MKRLIAILLLFSLCLLCFGCGSTSAEPQISYDGAKAHYFQKGATYSMEVQFEEPVTEGSTVSVLLDGEEILGFTADSSFTDLRLSSPLLELDKPYTLKVNGDLQCHGKSRPIAETTEPGYIPDPTVSTIPQEPMVETTAPAVSDETTEQNSPFGTPPTIAEEEISDGISSLLGNDATDSSDAPSQEILVTEALNADKTQSKDSALDPNVQLGGTVFTLTGTVTRFVSVRNAD